MPNEKDPFAEFGGSEIEPQDPFAEFGGSEIKTEKKSPSQSGQSGSGFSPLLKQPEKPSTPSTTEVEKSPYHPDNFRLTNPKPTPLVQGAQKEEFLKNFNPDAPVEQNVQAYEKAKTLSQRMMERDPFANQSLPSGEKVSSMVGTGLSAFGKGITNVVPATLETFSGVSQTLNNIPYVREFGAKLDSTLKKAGVPEKVRQDPAMAVADWARNGINTLFPEDPEYANHYFTQVMNGLGMATGIAMTPTAAAQIGSGAVQVFSDEYKQAKEGGADDNTAFGVAAFNSAIGGFLERLPVANALKRVNEATKGSILKSILGITTGTLEEAVTEGLQKALSNTTAAATYDKTREILDGVKQDAEVGGGVGFILNALLVTLGGKRTRAKTPEEKLEIKKAEELVNSVQKEINKKQTEAQQRVNKLKEDAIQESEAGKILQREPQETGIAGSERGGVEQVIQGEETPTQSPEEVITETPVEPIVTEAVTEGQPQIIQEEVPTTQPTKQVVPESSAPNPDLQDVESTAKALDKVNADDINKIADLPIVSGGTVKPYLVKSGRVAFNKNEYDEIFNNLDNKENELKQNIIEDEKQREIQLKLEQGKLDKLKRGYEGKQLVKQSDIDAIKKQQEKVDGIKEQLSLQNKNKNSVDLELSKYAIEKYPNVFESKDSYPFFRTKGDFKKLRNKLVSEAYHKAKADGSNPELVKAVEQLLTNEEVPTQGTQEAKTEPNTPVSTTAETGQVASNNTQPNGVTLADAITVAEKQPKKKAVNKLIDKHFRDIFTQMAVNNPKQFKIEC